MKHTFSTLVLVLASAATLAQAPSDQQSAQQPSSRNESLVRAARAAEAAMVASLKDMVLIESGSANLAGLARMADYTEARLKDLGARTERTQVRKGPGAATVKATFRGSGKVNIMLIAHMDTVYPEGILASQPWKEEGGRIYGPGIADDKGGIATVLHALKILNDAGWRDYAQLTVFFNPDEEIGSVGSAEAISALADQHDVVLSFEPTGPRSIAPGYEGLLLASSGTARATMEVKGRSSHAGVVPQLGRNALIELSYQLLQTYEIGKAVPGAQINWTVANAGEVRNQIPDRAVAVADVRTSQPGAAARLLGALKEKVQSGRLVPDTETTVSVEESRPPYAAGPRGTALARHAQSIYAELDGRTLVLMPMSGGASDASFAGQSGKAVVLEAFGLAGFGYHARDEFVERDSIVPRLYLTTRILQDIGSGRVGL